MLAKTSALEDTLILNALDVGIVILDRQVRIVLWNDWIARHTQTAASSVIGKTLVDVFPTLAATRLPSAVEDSFETGSSGFLTHSLNKLFPMRNEAGQELLHNVIVRPMSSGPAQQCLLQVNDVTVAVTRERVLRERQNARYRAIVDTAPDAIITINLDLSIQWLNGTAAQILGYAPDELVGQTIDVLLENKNDLTTSFLRVAKEDGQIGGALQIVGRRKDGALVPFEMSLARWSVDDRIFVTTIWRDITDRMLAETALRESEARLRRSNEELESRVAERTHEREVALAQLYESQKLETIGQLTGGVAHDFNNLLSVILGSLSLLKKRLPDDPRITRLVDGALQGAERGATLTKRLLAFARRQELKLEAAELQTLVPDIVDFLRQSVGPGIQITIDIPHDIDPIKTDINQLELALMNLAVNARDAMPQGGTLTISCRNETDSTIRRPAGLLPGEYVRLSVADTGEGMDEATRARALEPFFTTKGIGKGTGLGLSMVHGMTAQSGGAMDIESEVGKGTVISLWLPRARREDLMHEVPVPVAPPPVAESRTLRILLVDDDVLVSMNTANMLTDLGHDVVEAQSALTALQLLETDGPFEVVVTDYAMPGMNGLDFAVKAKSRCPEMLIILATGYAELPTNATVDFPRLSKPYNQEQLSRALASAITSGQ
jgi:PAS domain S-box-containing protein